MDHLVSEQEAASAVRLAGEFLEGAEGILNKRA